MNLLFAWRYFRAKKSTNAINIIAWVSLIAIVLITAAFIILLSVFNGFEGLVKSLYSSFYTDLRVGAKEGKSIMITEDQLSRIKQLKNVKAFSRVVEEKALLQNGDIQTIVYLKGVDDEYTKVTEVADNMVRGKFELGTADQAALVLGSGIENAIGIRTDRNLYPLTAYLFKRGVNINIVDPYQTFSADNVNSAGTFFIQQDIDNKYGITNIEFMKAMLGMPADEYSAIEIALLNARYENQTKREVQQIVGENYLVETKYEQNKSLYSVMNLEKWAIYGILTLMLVVAAFTMIGSLTMLVLEKQKDIQVLKALGADNNRIKSIFLNEGFLLAALGCGTGILLALLIGWAQVTFKLVTIEGGTFLIDHYPIEFRISDFVLVMFTVLVIALFASWFPSRKAALQPVELKS